MRVTGEIVTNVVSLISFVSNTKMLKPHRNTVNDSTHTYLCSHQLHEETWVLPLGGGQRSLQQTHFPDKTCVVREG